MEPESSPPRGAVDKPADTAGTFQRFLRRWLKSTSRRTFVVYPLLIIVLELLIRGGHLVVNPWGLVLFPWGYLQFRLAGRYRTRRGGGGPGMDVPPERLVTSGIYAWTRNPMYLGHFIYIAGLAITFYSLPALLLFFAVMPWYRKRTRRDEERLEELFGQEYLNYKQRVKLWLPGLF